MQSVAVLPRRTVCFNGATSEAFPVSSGVKQGCVLVPTLFGIFFSMLLQYAFQEFSEGVYIYTPGPMAGCSTSPVSAPRVKSQRYSSVRCFSLTTQPLHHTQKTACSSLSVASPTPVRSLV